MSSSAAQLQATADSLPPELLKIDERLIAERAVLQPLPSLRLQIGVPSVLRKVDRLSCVRYAYTRRELERRGHICEVDNNVWIVGGDSEAVISMHESASFVQLCGDSCTAM